MPCSAQVYPLLLAWLQALRLTPHRTSVQALARLLTALLVAQSLRPSALLRALPSSPAVPARQRYRRLTRLLDSPALAPAAATAALVHGCLALYRPAAPTLVLDTVRCGGWESVTVGLALPGRVQVLSAAALPVPWPAGQFTPTVLAVLRQVQQAWPTSAPRPHLVADRYFPSRQLFIQLHRWGWGYTVRLRARHAVTIAGQGRLVRALLAEAVPEAWRVLDGAYGQGRQPIPGRLVVGQGLVVLPHHQRDTGSAWARQQRAARQAYDRKEHRYPAVADSAPWVVLFTSEATVLAALRRYRQRYHTEASYRDLQGGWDGAHGWNLEPVAAQQPTAARVGAVVQLAALGQLVQQWVGSQIGPAASSGPGRWQHRAWTVHGRLSLFARGRLAFLDPSERLAAWLRTTLAEGTAQLLGAHATLRTVHGRSQMLAA
jgi:hypothetical protein